MALKPKTLTLEQRLQQSVSAASPSLMPVPYRRKEEEEVIPDIREVVDSPLLRSKIARLTGEYLGHQQEESAARKCKEAIGAELKALVKELPSPKMMCDGNRLTYYSTTRSTLDKQKLQEKGVSLKIINECSVASTSWALKITPPGQDE